MAKSGLGNELKKNNLKKSKTLLFGNKAYKLLKVRRPFVDFEVEVMLLASTSKRQQYEPFTQDPSELRETFAKVIDIRVKDYLSTPLPATHTLPPLGMVGDKLMTWRRTGQMFAGIMFTPGMPSLLAPVSLGVKCVSQHDGPSIARDTHDMCSEYNQKADQISGFGFDGQYLM